MVLIIENKRKEGKNTNIIKFKVQSMIHLYFFSKKKKISSSVLWYLEIPNLFNKKKERKKEIPSTKQKPKNSITITNIEENGT